MLICFWIEILFNYVMISDSRRWMSIDQFKIYRMLFCVPLEKLRMFVPHLYILITHTFYRCTQILRCSSIHSPSLIIPDIQKSPQNGNTLSSLKNILKLRTQDDNILDVVSSKNERFDVQQLCSRSVTWLLHPWIWGHKKRYRTKKKCHQVKAEVGFSIEKPFFKSIG